MRDIRDKIRTIAGHDGHGSLSRAAQMAGVSTRTLRRALISGPSPRLEAQLYAAVEKALIESGSSRGQAYEEELAEHRKVMRAHIKSVKKMMSERECDVDQQLRTAWLVGYCEALIDIAGRRDRQGWLLYHVKNFAADVRQSHQR